MSRVHAIISTSRVVMILLGLAFDIEVREAYQVLQGRSVMRFGGQARLQNVYTLSTTFKIQ